MPCAMKKLWHNYIVKKGYAARKKIVFTEKITIHSMLNIIAELIEKGKKDYDIIVIRTLERGYKHCYFIG